MPRDIRLALRIREDHYCWRITPKDAAQYERHHIRTEGGPLIISLTKLLTEITGKQCHTENHPISHST